MPRNVQKKSRDKTFHEKLYLQVKKLKVTKSILKISKKSDETQENHFVQCFFNETC